MDKLCIPNYFTAKTNYQTGLANFKRKPGNTNPKDIILVNLSYIFINMILLLWFIQLFASKNIDVAHKKFPHVYLCNTKKLTMSNTHIFFFRNTPLAPRLLPCKKDNKKKKKFNVGSQVLESGDMVLHFLDDSLMYNI